MGTLKKIEGNYFKECNVVMLPTKDAIHDCIIKGSDGKFTYSTTPFTQDYLNHMNWNSYHLYITSDDEIKEGDWYYTKMNLIKEFQIKQFKYENLYRNVSNTKSFKEKNFKIIATTDTSLKLHRRVMTSEIGVDEDYYYNLPQPSKSFIQKYCELGGIEKVLVEYKTNRYCVKCSTIRTNYLCKCGEPDNFNYKDEIKTDSHNTITIKPIKDSWNKDELIPILEEVMLLGAQCQEHNQNLTTNLEGWVKDNL